MPAVDLGLHLADARPTIPSPEQERAVRQAEALAASKLRLPPYAIRWVYVPLSEPSRRMGLTRFPDAGPVAIYLRSDLEPARAFACALHELKHASDRAAILSGALDRRESEASARLFAVTHEHLFRPDADPAPADTPTPTAPPVTVPRVELPRSTDLTLPDVLAVDLGAWESMRPVIARYAAGAALPEATTRRFPTRPTSREAGATMAVIPLTGLLTRRGGGLLAFLFGGSSLADFAREVRAAADNPDVAHIVLLVDSPGGEVAGTPEAADVVFQARQRKRVTAMVEGLGASAAYWIASQAHEIVATPSSLLGSVGIVATHVDVSEAERKSGVKTTQLASAPGKLEGNPHEPLSDEARAEIERKLRAYHEMFVSAVVRGRGIPPAAVEGTKGRVLLAADAVRARLADQLGTLDTTLAKLANTPGHVTALAAPPTDPEAVERAMRRRLLRLA
jgi:signal peptide peptidase SppA